MKRPSTQFFLLALVVGHLSTFTEAQTTITHTTFAEEMDEANTYPITKMTTANTNAKGGRHRRFLQSVWERKKENKHSDEDDCDHLRDKHDITCAPSFQPSSTPSEAPSLSSAPTLSSAPSSTPSAAPTKAPTQTPSANPTGMPSATPTNHTTGTPSVAPTGIPFASLVLMREDGSTWQESTCQTSLPAGASAPQAEATEFEYFLQVTPRSNPDVSLKVIEQALATLFAEGLLCC